MASGMTAAETPSAVAKTSEKDFMEGNAPIRKGFAFTPYNPGPAGARPGGRAPGDCANNGKVDAGRKAGVTYESKRAAPARGVRGLPGTNERTRTRLDPCSRETTLPRCSRSGSPKCSPLRLDALTDVRARARVQARIERLANGNAGDSKAVGEGVSELRIDYGPGYRV